MLLKIVYLLTCRVLGLTVLAFRCDRAKDAELLVQHPVGCQKSACPVSCGDGEGQL
jgi:hypothetical protein